VATAFPFVAAVSSTGLANAFTTLPTLDPDLSDPAALNQLTRTILDADFRSPIAEQFSLEIQRALDTNTVFRSATWARGALDSSRPSTGNPRTLCSAVPIRIDDPATGAFTVLGCPRVNPNAGVIQIRSNQGSSIYHSMQLSLDRRPQNGFSAGAHYTWSAVIDTASDPFNPSVRGEVAIAQNSFNTRVERARSTYDRPHRLSVNAVYELPFLSQSGGGSRAFPRSWQLGGFPDAPERHTVWSVERF